MPLPRQFWVKCFPFVFLKFLDEGVLHFGQETAVELVPFRRLEVTLLEDGSNWLLHDKVNEALEVLGYATSPLPSLIVTRVCCFTEWLHSQGN